MRSAPSPLPSHAGTLLAGHTPKPSYFVLSRQLPASLSLVPSTRYGQRRPLCRGPQLVSHGLSRHSVGIQIVALSHCLRAHSSTHPPPPHHHHHGTPAGSALEPEVISLDSIEVLTTTTTVESTSPTASSSVFASDVLGSAAAADSAAFPHHALDDHGASPPSDTSPLPSSHQSRLRDVTHQRTSARTAAYCDVTSIDPFARGRVVNFIRRMGAVEGEVFSVTELQACPSHNSAHGEEAQGESAAPSTRYIATCRVPLPEPHVYHVAEGLGESKKEAELLAAMHAERLCDALGVPLFRLRTAQQKHAETVRRREGRYAPMPGDPVKPIGTPLPPPLRFLRAKSTAATVATPSSSASAAPPPQLHPHGQGKDAGRSGREVDSHWAKASPAAESATAKSSSVPAASSPPSSATIPEAGNALDANQLLFGSPAAPNTAPQRSLDWPTKHSTPFISRDVRRMETYQHNPLRLYDHLVPTYTDAEHAERVRNYASTVVYPWQQSWDSREMTPAPALRDVLQGPSPLLGWQAAAAQPRHTDVREGDVAAAVAAAALKASSYDHTDGGVWQLVNDRNLRRSPTPDLALVLPYIYDGDHAYTRLTEYYAQHGGTLKEHLRVRQTPLTAAAAGRWEEAELRLVGVPVTAKGLAATKEHAVRLAAMHAELMIDALGQPLFPADPARQARHAEAVAGYGRWAMNPLTGDTTPPASHMSLPRPLKQRVGTDDAALSELAPLELRRRRSEEERIIAAQAAVLERSLDVLEVNPPAELLEEAYVMLQEWQTHIARSRYTNLYVLFDLNEDSYRGVTLLPVPARFGVRGGCGTGVSAKQTMQLCALHALDTLASLGVPLCVDADKERRYVQRRAALGLALPGSLRGVCSARRLLPTRAAAVGPAYGDEKVTAATVEGGSGSGGVGGGGDADEPVPYLPMYKHEGQQTRLVPSVADSVNAGSFRVPHDYCLFHAATETVLTEVGNEARICVTNYLEHVAKVQTQRQQQTTAEARSSVAHLPQCYPSFVRGDGDGAPAPHLEMLRTQLWAAKHGAASLPFTAVAAQRPIVPLHTLAFLPIPLPEVLRPGTGVGGTNAAPKHKDGGAATSPLLLLPSLPYVLACGIAPKRRDAVRACFVHAAALLHAAGIDVFETYPANTPRVRCVPKYEALRAYLETGPVMVVPPYTPDGRPNRLPLQVLEQQAHNAVFGTGQGGEQMCGADTDSTCLPRPVMHMMLKSILEDKKHTTLPRPRSPVQPNDPFTAKQKKRLF